MYVVSAIYTNYSSSTSIDPFPYNVSNIFSNTSHVLVSLDFIKSIIARYSFSFLASAARKIEEIKIG